MSFKWYITLDFSAFVSYVLRYIIQTVFDHAQGQSNPTQLKNAPL